MKRVSLFIFGLLAAGLGGWWVYKSFSERQLWLDDKRECRVRFHQWSSGRCVIDYLQGGALRGKAVLRAGLFTHPFAVIPGQDRNVLICFSELDTTYAVFAIDLKSIQPNGVSIPSTLSETVDFSQLSLRACTKSEVAFIDNFVRSTDLPELSRYVYGGLHSEIQRAEFLCFLVLATSENNWRDPQLKDAKPQILPEG